MFGENVELGFYENLTWVFLFICCACVNSVTPSPPQVRVCPPIMLPEDGANLSSARGILSLIQSSTRRAYQQILDVLDTQVTGHHWLANFSALFFGSLLVDCGVFLLCLHLCLLLRCNDLKSLLCFLLIWNYCQNSHFRIFC